MYSMHIKSVSLACLLACMYHPWVVAATDGQILSDMPGYQGLRFYYGDNHIHTGFSGDNNKDAHPLYALLNAIQHIHDHLSKTPILDDQKTDLGGYFLFLSDHLQYVPTRHDMLQDTYETMKKETQADEIDLTGPDYTFTAFFGGELTGLARSGHEYMPWDDKFSHLNLFNIHNLSPFMENDLLKNLKGTVAMDRLANISEAIAQFNHPGYADEPRTGNHATALYPYTKERDRVFKFFEVTNGDRSTWGIGAAQYNICLQKGYHVSPVVGTDSHNTKEVFLFHRPDNKAVARTVVIAPSTLFKTLEERPAILLDSMRSGMVYATESPDIRIKFSINDIPIGQTISRYSDEWVVKIAITDPSAKALHDTGLAIQTIELLQNKVCEKNGKPIHDYDVTDEYDCVKTLKKWSVEPGVGEIRLPPVADEVVDQLTLPVDSLTNVQYIYLKVTQKNGNRSMTTPIYFHIS